jgi:hypothetical protein
MQCEVCGNDYRDGITVTQRNDTYVFDCFECAIHALAPTCAHCGCKVIGHGLSREGEIFCCEHCVRMSLSAAGAIGDDDVDEDEDFEVDDDLEDDDVDDAEDEDEATAPRRR